MNVHFTADPIRNAADGRRGDPRLRELVHLELLMQGIYTARRGFVALSLPLSEDDVDALVAHLEAIADRCSPYLMT